MRKKDLMVALALFLDSYSSIYCLGTYLKEGGGFLFRLWEFMDLKPGLDVLTCWMHT